MENVLKFIEDKIDIVNKRRCCTQDENGDELDIDDYDGEGIFEDGVTEGLYDAYTTVRDEIVKRMNAAEASSVMTSKQ